MCHPDKFSGNEIAKEVNLNAIQTLNQLIDEVETQLKQKNLSRSNVNDVKSKYTVEFMVPSGMKKGSKVLTTRRSVVMSFPMNVIGNDAEMLSSRAATELIRLLKAADAKIKPEHERQIQENIGEQLRDSIDIEDHRNSGGFRQGKNPAEMFRGTNDWRKRQSGFDIDWQEETRQFNVAVARMERNIATLGMTSDKVKRQMVAGVVGRARFIGGITTVDQLVTLRRISLILEDNFDNLRMEDAGAIWEELVLVLKNYNENEAEKRPRARGESGFIFKWGEDDVVTVTVPLDFKDWQFIDEFRRNLVSFHWDEDDDDYVAERTKLSA